MKALSFFLLLSLIYFCRKKFIKAHFVIWGGSTYVGSLVIGLTRLDFYFFQVCFLQRLAKMKGEKGHTFK